MKTISHSMNANQTCLGDMYVHGVVIAAGIGVTGANFFSALLDQTGTAAPSATVLESDFGQDIVWARTSAGIYTATLAAGDPHVQGIDLVEASAPIPFPAGSTIVLCGQPSDPLHAVVASRGSDTVISVKTYVLSVEDAALTATLTDGLLAGVPIAIRSWQPSV
jgi:hypothetical protein